MKYLLVLLALLAPLPLKAQTPSDWQSLVQHDGQVLYYHYSPAPTRGPVVVILQGSECLRVSDKYASLMETLQRARLGVLRVEKPGLTPTTPVGECPLAYLRSNTLDRRVLDVLAVVGELRKRLDWDGRLALVGGSEGGMVAALCAPLIPETRAVAILSSGGGLTFGQEIEETIVGQMQRSGAPQAKVDDETRSLQQVFEQARREPSTLREWASDGKLARNTHLWLSRVVDAAAYRPLLRVECPVLLVHGENDQSTPVSSALSLQKAFLQAGKTNLELRVERDGVHQPSAQSIQATLQWVIGQLPMGERQ